jgi:serine/threonine protein kinase
MRALADYKLLYALGARYREGGYAKVYYEATRKVDGVTVALKKPKMGRRAAERLRREIDVQIDLAHPNIMPILDADPDRRPRRGARAP